ncbi:hypothetical protein MLD38_030365 [Melastoma candidum]|uniref:Uncharacterized protein n=1 Tax=Melastoma candidum TaxID=119954 RepID=A0ACB9MLE3_9MYRT|nr:hypothetical protein MLD38_030365 [Melastoma candidum]
MGFLRRLFGVPSKRDKASSSSSSSSKQGWQPRRSFIRSLEGGRNRLTLPPVEGNGSSYGKESGDIDPNKHAIAVAAATAAVAEAALAAAQAAAEVVRLTGGRGGSGRVMGREYLRVEELAAVKIQSAFRGYLARRALRALKALVKLQALVRGHIVRKQMADMLRRMHTLVRVQARIRAGRSYTSLSSQSSSKSSLSHHPRCGSLSNFKGSVSLEGAKFGSNRLDRWMEESVSNNHGAPTSRYRHEDDRNAKILEVDTWKPHMNGAVNRSRAFDSTYISPSTVAFDSPSKYSTKGPNPVPSLSSEEVMSFRSQHSYGVKCDAHQFVENNQEVASALSRPGSSRSTRRGPLTPAKSESGWGFYNGYSGHPNYMSNTQSSRAKVRSQSAPRQRLEFDIYNSGKRGSLQSYWDTGSNSERGYPINTDLRKKTSYTVSGRLNRLSSSDMR